MTRKKKLKRVIRDFAEKNDVGYSTARRGVLGRDTPTEASPDTSDADQSLPPEEVLRQGLMHDVPGEFITFDLSDRRITSISAPPSTVGYAIVGDDGSGVLPVAVDVPTPIVFCRTTSREEWPQQVFQLVSEKYPELHLRPTSAIRNPPMIGAPTRYWAQWLTLREDGGLTREMGRRGLHSLDDVLSGKRGPMNDPARRP